MYVVAWWSQGWLLLRLRGGLTISLSWRPSTRKELCNLFSALQALSSEDRTFVEMVLGNFNAGPDLYTSWLQVSALAGKLLLDTRGTFAKASISKGLREIWKMPCRGVSRRSVKSCPICRSPCDSQDADQKLLLCILVSLPKATQCGFGFWS